MQMMKPVGVLSARYITKRALRNKPAAGDSLFPWDFGFHFAEQIK